MILSFCTKRLKCFLDQHIQSRVGKSKNDSTWLSRD